MENQKVYTIIKTFQDNITWVYDEYYESLNEILIKFKQIVLNNIYDWPKLIEVPLEEYNNKYNMKNWIELLSFHGNIFDNLFAQNFDETDDSKLWELGEIENFIPAFIHELNNSIEVSNKIGDFEFTAEDLDSELAQELCDDWWDNYFVEEDGIFKFDKF